MRKIILNYFRGTFLFITAKILQLILYPIGVTYSFITHFFRFGWLSFDKYLFKCALIDDIHGNTYLAKLFNDTLIKKITVDGKIIYAYKFGNPRETISSVLGKNKERGTLTKSGLILDFILHIFDNNHSEKSVEEIIIKFPNKK